MAIATTRSRRRRDASANHPARGLALSRRFDRAVRSPRHHPDLARRDVGERRIPLRRARPMAAKPAPSPRRAPASRATTPRLELRRPPPPPWRPACCHGAISQRSRMPEVLAGTGTDSVAGRLKETGYATVSVSDNLLASPRHRGTYAGWDRTDLVQTTMSGNFIRDAVTIFPDTQLPMLVAEALSFNAVFDVYVHGKHSPYQSERTFAAMAQAADEVAALRLGAFAAAPLALPAAGRRAPSIAATGGTRALGRPPARQPRVRTVPATSRGQAPAAIASPDGRRCAWASSWTT